MRSHEGEPTLQAGVPPSAARAAVLALHGRGADASGMLSFLAAELGGLDGIALLAPQARHATWYPRPFLAPIVENQPWLDSALERVGTLVDGLATAGIGRERIVLFGFSQGACLASEYAARHPARWGAVVAATGGRIGPPGTPFPPRPGFARTPVHLSAGDPDPHVPWRRVEETAAFFTASGAEVELRRAPGYPHAVHPAAVEFLQRQLLSVPPRT